MSRHNNRLNVDDIKIESGVKVPERVYKRRSKYLDLYNRMKPGQSILLKGVMKTGISTSQCMSRIAKQLGGKIQTRVTEEGLRIWRVK